MRPIRHELLFSGCKDSGRLVGDPEDDAGSRAESGEAENRCGIESQSRSLYLRPNAKLPHALGAQRSIAAPSIHSSVDLADDIYAIVHSKDAGESVKKDIVLSKSLERRRHDSEA